MIMTVLERIESLRTRNQTNSSSVNKDVYRLICHKNFLGIKSSRRQYKIENPEPPNKSGSFNETCKKKTSYELKTNLFKGRFSDEKENQTKLQLNMRPFKQELVQQAILLILESIYEPSFATYPNNFEKRYCCSRGIVKLKTKFENVPWIIQGDFNEDQGVINLDILIKILRKKIQDEKFLHVIWSVLQNNGDIGKPLERNTTKNKVVITLLNIYLSEFDILLEELNLKSHKLRIKKSQIKTLTTKSTSESFICKSDLPNPQIDLVRSGKAWIIGVGGTKRMVEKVGKLVRVFLIHKLVLTPKTIKIHYVSKTKIKFLGYVLIKRKPSLLYKTNRPPKIKCIIPMAEVITKLSNSQFCTKLGKGIGKPNWILYSDSLIIQRYNKLLMKLKKQYILADNYEPSIKRLEYILRVSCAYTLAEKHRSNVSSQMKRVDNLDIWSNLSRYNKARPFRNEVTSFEIGLKAISKNSQILSNNSCIVCHTSKNLERQNIKTLNQKMLLVENGDKNILIQRLNRKQVCICKPCHSEIYKQSL